MVAIRISVAIVFVLSLLVAGYLGFASVHLPYDKAIHFTTFCVLTMEFYFLIDTKNKSLKILRYATFGSCTLFGSFFSEVVQSLVNPVRVFDLHDIIANVCGSLVGLGICYVVQGQMLKRTREMRYKKLGRGEEAAVGAVGEDFVHIKMQDIEESVRE